MKPLTRSSLTKIINDALTKRFGVKIERAYRTDLWGAYRSDAMALASAVNISATAVTGNKQRPEDVAPSIEKRICSWFLPYFDRATYGGIMTALRLANFLKTHDGIRNHFVICGPCDTQEVARSIEGVFPNLAPANVISLDGPDAIMNVPTSDYAVCTLWTTAYALATFTRAALKFYLIQDFEPDFYPAGSTSAQAEYTYRFGFKAICNTQTLADIYRRDYNGIAHTLVPAIDTNVFFATGLERIKTPFRLFFYARPSMPRNGFELAAASFRIVKAKLGDAIEIQCAGSDWNPADYKLDGVVSALGMLPYAKTGELYRNCHAGLALMMTRHPSYLPFELMACGALVITTRNKWNEWLLRDQYNCLIAEPTATDLADTICKAVEEYENYEDLRINAMLDIGNNHASWDMTLRHTADFMHDIKSV